ncbi:MAG: TatD family hydrolase [Puniceicoccales bacterium]|jgi:TatD DNase family protein|nr:TatD family hydrolase [Puniceicoccales bacterium]
MDSHVHIDFFDSKQRDDCIRDALAAGIDYFVVPGVSREKWAQLFEIARRENVFFALGEHPLELTDVPENESRSEILLREIKKTKETRVGRKLVAIGEIGLDYYHLSTKNLERREIQRRAFREQLFAAVEEKLPAIIHCRDKDGSVDAWNDANSIITECEISPKDVLFHSFSYGPEQVKKWCECGGYVSISGTITKPNAQEIRAALPFIPREKMLIETDSPFLLPHALRIAGKEQPANEPKNVVEVARFVGEILGKDKWEILSQTRENGLRFFHINRQ